MCFDDNIRIMLKQAYGTRYPWINCQKDMWETEYTVKHPKSKKVWLNARCDKNKIVLPYVEIWINKKIRDKTERYGFATVEVELSQI